MMLILWWIYINDGELLDAKWWWYWWWSYVWKMMVLMMVNYGVNVCNIESYVLAFISRILCVQRRWLKYLYTTTVIIILCIQRRWLWYGCIKRMWLLPHAYKVVSWNISYIDNWWMFLVWLCAWWLCTLVNLVIYVLGEYVKMWICTRCNVILICLKLE